MVQIKYENGKYIVDANIHCEINTVDIAKVKDTFALECATGFAEAVRDAFELQAKILNKSKNN